MSQNNKLVKRNRWENRWTQRQRRFNFSPLACGAKNLREGCERRGRISTFVSGIIMQKQGGGEGRDRARSKRRGRARTNCWIYGSMVAGHRGGGGGEERRGRCLDPPRCVIVEISPVASEKGAKPERNRPRMWTVLPLCVHFSFLFPPSPFFPTISNVPSPPPSLLFPTCKLVKKISQGDKRQPE